MQRLAIAFAMLFLIITNSYGQTKPVISGPMIGHTELRTASIWLEFAPDVLTATVSYRMKQTASKMQIVTGKLKGGDFNTHVFTLSRLEPGTTYSYYVSAGRANGILDSGEVTTQPLWQFKGEAPDFSFLAGSCAYFNESGYDRPGTPYGKSDSAIFRNMSNENAQLMLWLGDNWYTREVDYHSEYGLFYRASHDRQTRSMKPFLKKMPQYAIWDDHDYGPNDSDKSYHLKSASRKVFTRYWANPSYGMDDQGIYSRFSYYDIDFFLLDDRWWRSNDRMADSIDGKPNPDKTMFGREQMDWLKNSLLHSNTKSNVSFRVIVTGSQMLNQYSLWDAFRKFPLEYAELMNFLQQNRINGVIFLTGDRHHSEIIRLERPSAYPLYDITISPLTSGAAKSSGAEANNPGRVSQEIAVQNYGRLALSGKGRDRKLTVEMKGVDGKTIETWSVTAAELSWTK